MPTAGTVSRLACRVLGGWLVMAGRVHGQDAPAVDFDPAFFMPGDAATLDMSRFARGNPVLPGPYDVDVWMNGEWQARKAVRFAAWKDRGEAIPCIAMDEFVAYGLDPSAASAVNDAPCEPLGGRIASATTRFDVSEQRLDIEVPQAVMARRRPGIVPPTDWEHGVTAGLLGWRVAARHAATARQRDTAFVAGADAGINVGAWRLRHGGTWAGQRYSRRHTYLERPLGAWRSRLRIGEFPLADDMFPPVRLRGASIASDARMAADALGGYAPRVRGVAASHATVRITQNGILLRELVVPPGPFEVDDLYAAGRGGDIDVDVEEHGRHRTFRIPFFPVPELLREGRTAYAASVGRGVVARGLAPGVVQASWRHGFPGDTTGYAGARLSQGTSSIVVGGAVATPAGAFAMDAFHSMTSGGRSTLWRVRHGKQWADGTLVSLRAAQGRDMASLAPRSRVVRVGGMRRFDVLVQKDLGGRGSLGVNVSQATRGHGGETTRELAASWARAWDRLSMDVTIRRATDTSGQLSVSMPLGVPLSTATLYASALGGQRAGGLRMGIYGSADEAGTTQYGAAMAREHGRRPRFDGSVSRRLRAGEIVASVDRSSMMQAASLSASGGLVFHHGGVTPALRLGDAMALVRARGAQGASVSGSTDTRIGRRGYAVVPHLAPYRWNAIDRDPTGTSLDVGFVSTHRRAAPTAGAVVLVPFETDVSKTLLVTARLHDGRPLPFGAEVLDAGSRSVGRVGQGGRIFLRTENSAGRWRVRWSDGTDGQCVLRLLGDVTTAAGMPRGTGVCE
jgi:outer membrane usher protein